MKNKAGYFFELKQVLNALKQAFKGKYSKIFALLFLIALPIAIVEGYSSSTVAHSVMSVLPSIDINSPSAAETILNSISSDTQNTSSMLLSILMTLLQCSILIIAVTFTWQALSGKNNIINDSTVFAKHILRKLAIVFLITYLASYVLSFLLSASTLSLSVLLIIPIPIVALPLSLIMLFILSAIITAMVDSYSSVMIGCSVMGRTRFSFSMLYARLLYKGNFAKTAVYYGIINAVASVITLIPYGVALLMTYLDIPFAIVFWALASLVQCLVTGAVMCIYTARMMQLEVKNISLLRPLSFVVMDQDQNGEDDNDRQDRQNCQNNDDNSGYDEK